MHLTVIAVWVLRILGLLLIYCAVFLHEDEEGRIQNLIEEWWIKVDDNRKQAISRSASFIKVAAGIADRSLSRLFGQRLFSARVVCVSICYSIASWLFSIAITPMTRSYSHRDSLALLVAFIGLGSVSALINKRALLFVWILVVLGAAVPLFFEFWSVRGANSAQVVILAYALSVSFVFDVLCILFIRWLLRRAAASVRSVIILALLFLNGVVVALLVSMISVPLLLSASLVNHLRAVVTVLENGIVMETFLFTSMMSGFDFLACSYVAVIMLIMLLHRLLWPVIERPLYACARYGIIEQKSLLWTLGGVLLIGPPHLISLGHLLLEKIFGAAG